MPLPYELTTTSIIKYLKKQKEDTNKVKALIDLCSVMSNINSDTVILISNKAIELAAKLKWKKGIIKSYLWLGHSYFLKGDFTKALSLGFNSLKIAEEIGDKLLIIKSNANIGNIYKDIDEDENALKYYLKALRISEEIKDKNRIGQQLGNIGNVYRNRKDYSKALTYYFKALTISEELGLKNNASIWLNNIGNVYSDRGDSALEAGDEKYANNILFPKAISYYQKVLLMASEMNDKVGSTRTLANMGSLYIEIRKYNEAEKCLLKAFVLSDSIAAMDYKKRIEESLSHLYYEQGRYKEAIYHYQNFINIRDSIINGENIKKQTQTEMQFEFDKQQIADSIRSADKLIQENLKHEQEIKQQKIFTYGGIIGFLLMIIVAAVSFRAYKAKQKANEIILEQKELVEEKQKEIMDSIKYAKRIQESLLPTKKYIERILNKKGNAG